MSDDLSNIEVPDNLSHAWARHQLLEQLNAQKEVPGRDAVFELLDRALSPVIEPYVPVPGYDTSHDKLLEDIVAKQAYSKEVVDGRRLEPEFLRELNVLAAQYGGLTVATLIMLPQPDFNFRLFVDEPHSWPFTGATWRYTEPPMMD